MYQHTTVIVSACFFDQRNQTWRTSNRLSEESYASLEEAMTSGQNQVGEKRSVIVRPSYNEEDEKGRYYREWRSFNGSPFEECRWDL